MVTPLIEISNKGEDKVIWSMYVYGARGIRDDDLFNFGPISFKGFIWIPHKWMPRR